MKAIKYFVWMFLAVFLSIWGISAMKPDITWHWFLGYMSLMLGTEIGITKVMQPPKEA